MAMVKLDKELNDKLVRYEILMNKWCDEYEVARYWADRLIDSPNIKTLAKTMSALFRKMIYHKQLLWLINHDWDVAQYNHHRVKLMNA